MKNEKNQTKQNTKEATTTTQNQQEDLTEVNVAESKERKWRRQKKDANSGV